MTVIRDGAWWCAYCAANKDGCTFDVPYYCSSHNCRYWIEHDNMKPVKGVVKHTLKWYQKRVLVETI